MLKCTSNLLKATVFGLALVWAFPVLGNPLIKDFEGLRLEAYKCSAGVWTIGYGHTGPITLSDGREAAIESGDTITVAEAERLLKRDLRRFEAAVRGSVKVELTQYEFDALVSLAYNIGTKAFRKSTLLKKLNQNKRLAAANEFLRWNKVKGVPIYGLSKRRAAERSYFLTGAAKPLAP